MTSILEIYDSLPDYEKEILDCDDVLHCIRERQKANAALELIPDRLRKYYVAHFGRGFERCGEFVGFVCVCCERWLGWGHKSQCPMNELMGDFDCVAADKAMKKSLGDGALMV